MKNKGFWLALVAYGIWGLFPIYWKLLKQVDAVQIIGHRIVWSFVILILYLAFSNQIPSFLKVIFKPRILITFFVAAILIGINWYVYVWAVNKGFIVETSLGYFINPLLSVVIGVIVFREKLRTMQWIAISLAFAGVLYLSIEYGRLPWIALVLAFSFGSYGLMKKVSSLKSDFGLTIETGTLFIPAFIYLIIVNNNQSGAFLHSSFLVNLLLIGAGLITIIPLIMFSVAAQQIPLSMIGILQYTTPTLQFLIGIFIYHEPFSWSQLGGFGLVWVALILFVVENLWYRKFRKMDSIFVIENNSGEEPLI